jgi:hypothetical protein
MNSHNCLGKSRGLAAQHPRGYVQLSSLGLSLNRYRITVDCHLLATISQ